MNTIQVHCYIEIFTQKKNWKPKQQMGSEQEQEDNNKK
jgi:hypothetical protein